MISETRETLDDALEILKAILQGEEVSKNKNSFLYEKYRYRSDVEDMLVHIAGKLELRVYSGKDGLFLCPEAGSRLFGWTNEELKKKISYIYYNSELYTGYFIIMTLITMFYKEAYPDTPIAYIKINDFIKEVSHKMDSILKIEDLEAVSQENQFDFESICKVWQRLPDAREGVTGGKNDKIAFVENICKFLNNEKLIQLDMDQRNIYPTDRFKTIIWNYYEERENRKDLLAFVRDLEVKD